jgi:hypothetical protein
MTSLDSSFRWNDRGGDNCESLDKQIDAEVYKLYGLNDDEIKIVEGKE